MPVTVILTINVTQADWELNFGQLPDWKTDVAEYVRGEIEGQLQNAVSGTITVTA